MSTNIVVVKQKKLKSPTLFTGLPGIGLVGKIAADYMLKQFKAEKIAEIYSDSFPPSVHTRNAIVEMIRDEVYVTEFKGKHYLFLVGPVQPSLDFRAGSAAEHYEFASKIVEAMKSLGVKQVYTLAGLNIGDKRLEKEPGVVVASSSKKVLEEMSRLGAIADKKEGLISGAAGLILGLARHHGIEGACLMGETSTKLVYGDHGAAKKIIELLIKRFGFNVKLDQIAQEAKNIEAAFAQLSKQFEETAESEEPPKNGLPYVR
jgi:uncharacterized protein (TIGR00162 family)